MINLLIEALDPLRVSMYATFGHQAAKLIAALLIVLLAWAVAGTARWVTRRAARTEWLERLLLRSGVMAGLVEPSLAGSRTVITGALYWSILLAGTASALAVLSEQAATHLGTLILILLPNLLLGCATVIFAWWLGGYCARSVLISMANEGMAAPWWWAGAVRGLVVAAGVALASEMTGFATTLVRSAFLIVLAGATFAATQAIIPLLRSHLEERLSPANGKTRDAIDDRLLR